MQSKAQHLLLIEFLRFLAAFSVLIWHYQNFTFVNFEHIELNVSEQPFYSLLWPFYEQGLLGVQVFWVISGFIFFWKYKKILIDRSIDAKKFFVLRFSRLYPLHILTLLFVSLLQYLYHLKTGSYFTYQLYDFYHFFQHIFIASNWLSSEFSFNGPIWSVSCEVLVYVFFYIYISRYRSDIKTTFFIFLICSLLTLFHFDHNVTNCLKYFLLGGLSFEFATLKMMPKNRARFNRNLILSILSLMTLLLLTYKLNIFRFKHYTFVLLILLPATLYFAPIKIEIDKRVVSFINGLGNLTYSSYLTHFPIQLLIVNWFAYHQTRIPFYEPWFLVLYIFTVFIVSFFTFHFFEMPTQKYLRSKMLSLG
jgi:peptidoglycan/LPS O-acetylase OafA/YrhL